jgi:hypothetical protein
LVIQYITSGAEIVSGKDGCEEPLIRNKKTLHPEAAPPTDH